MPITDLPGSGSGLRRDELDPDKIKANLKTKRIGRKILVYNRTSSTQAIAAEYAKNKGNDVLVIFAEEQTAGRGRAENEWYSSRSDSILCSIVLCTGGSRTAPAELLSLTCAVAVAEAIGSSAKGQAKIKWPNDIILNGKKVAGILLESKTDNSGNTCIIGIGINCHQKKDSFPLELQPIATSIDIENHATCDRISLAKRLLTSLDNCIEVAQKDSDEIVGQWRELSIQLGHRVALVFQGHRFIGNCIGVDPQKGLTLQLDSGAIRFFNAAHTTIAKQS